MSRSQSEEILTPQLMLMKMVSDKNSPIDCHLAAPSKDSFLPDSNHKVVSSPQFTVFHGGPRLTTFALSSIDNICSLKIWTVVCLQGNFPNCH